MFIFSRLSLYISNDNNKENLCDNQELGDPSLHCHDRYIIFKGGIVRNQKPDTLRG